LALEEDVKPRVSAKILTSSAEVLEICLDKVKTYEKLKGVIPIPPYFFSSSSIFMKPSRGKGGRGIELLPTEFLMGAKWDEEEVDVDVLALNGQLLACVCKTRLRTYGGTLAEGEIVERPELVEQIKKALKVLPVDYLSVWQFMGGELLEINPRIGGATGDFELVDLAIKLATGEIKPEEIKYKPPIGSKITRFLTQKIWQEKHT